MVYILEIQCRQITIQVTSSETQGTSSDQPTELLDRRVIGVCPECQGEGVLWACDEDFTSHWAKRCEVCNCVGYLLDIPNHLRELDHIEIPF